MKLIKFLAIIVAYSVSFNICHAKENLLWNDYLQDATQINTPVEYINTYNKYSIINPNVKIMLTDFGNIVNTKKNITYILKKYGVQILNGKVVYDVLRTAVPLESHVDFSLLYNSKSIVAFRVRETSTINYVRVPFNRTKVTAYLYNLKNNKFIEIPVVLSDSDNGSEKTDLLMGDEVKYDSKKGQYTYIANIKTYKDGKTSPFKMVLDNNLKCISSTLGCDITGVAVAQKAS